MMHGVVAWYLGDTTAEEAGRLTLNPLKHVDLVLTILLPTVLILLHMPPIFVAKPVPFDPRNVRYNEFGAALVGLAGPFANLLLAVIAALIFRLCKWSTFSTIGESVMIFIEINLFLFVFNLLPLPPLDGSRLLYAFAPEPLQRLMYQFEAAGLGLAIPLLIILSPVISPFVSNLVSDIYSFLLR